MRWRISVVTIGELHGSAWFGTRSNVGSGFWVGIAMGDCARGRRLRTGVGWDFPNGQAVQHTGPPLIIRTVDQGVNF